MDWAEFAEFKLCVYNHYYPDMDVEDENMEQFHVISLLGADARLHSHTTDFAQARRELNGKTLKLHARHAVSWLIRGVVILGLFMTSQYYVQGTIGGAIAWTSGFLSFYLLWYTAKGHLKIQNDRQAKLYWLENDADNRAFSSNDPIVATMPMQEPVEPALWHGRSAS